MTHSDERKGRFPPLSHNIDGRHRETCVLPRVVTNTLGGLAAEEQPSKLGVMQDAGDEVTCDRDRN
jgi:hypothetical protein